MYIYKERRKIKRERKMVKGRIGKKRSAAVTVIKKLLLNS